MNLKIPLKPLIKVYIGHYSLLSVGVDMYKYKVDFWFCFLTTDNPSHLSANDVPHGSIFKYIILNFVS